MVRHTIRGANSHNRHRIATYDSNPSQTRKSTARETIDDHPEKSVNALEDMLYQSRRKEFGYFDLNDADIGPFSYSKDNTNWRTRFNYAPLTRYPIEITDYNSAAQSETLATTTATGLVGTPQEESLGSSRQYQGATRPTTSQWHTIGGASGGNFFSTGISTFNGITANSKRPAARFMLNPMTGVMKNVSDPWTVNSLEASQYVFQIGRHTGLTSGHPTKENNGWTLDTKYEVTWGTNPVSNGDYFDSQPAHAEGAEKKEATWNRVNTNGDTVVGNQGHWRKHVAGLGHSYGKTMLDGAGAGSFNYGTDYVSNPKWHPMTSRVYTPSSGKSTVDTGVISSYTSNILLAGTGVVISGGVANITGEFSDGVLKDGVTATSGLTWAGDTSSADVDTGKHGGIFIPYYDQTVGDPTGNTSTIGVKYIGHSNFNGMSKGFVAQYTGATTTAESGQLLGNLKDTTNEYYTEFINSWENAFGVDGGGTVGETHVMDEYGTLSTAAKLTGSEKLNRKALMDNTNKSKLDLFIKGPNKGRDPLSHAWVQYETADDGMAVPLVITAESGAPLTGGYSKLKVGAELLDIEVNAPEVGIKVIAEHFSEGGTDGTYSKLPLKIVGERTPVDGWTLAYASITVSGGKITSIKVTDGGRDYRVGDKVQIAGAGRDFGFEDTADSIVGPAFIVTEPEINDERRTIKSGENFSASLGVATGPSEAQRNDEFRRKHVLAGEDFTLFTHSAADMYHPTALVVAQFVRDTAEVFDDMHITELYPNANNMSAKTTWMRNYDIVFNIELDEAEDSLGPSFIGDVNNVFNQGQTFKFSQSAVPYKIREVGQRTINANGNHEWEIQAMPAWDDWDEESQPFAEWRVAATSGGANDTVIDLNKLDEIFQDRKFNITTGDLASTINNGFFGKFGLAGSASPDDIVFFPHEELPAGMSEYSSGDIVTVAGFKSEAVTTSTAGVPTSHRGILAWTDIAAAITTNTTDATASTTTADVEIKSTSGTGPIGAAGPKFEVVTSAAGAVSTVTLKGGTTSPLGYNIDDTITLAVPGASTDLVITLTDTQLTKLLIPDHEYILIGGYSLDAPSKLSITAESADSSATYFEVRGFLGDYYQTEIITGGNATTINGNKYFTRITSIKSDSGTAAGTAEITIGWQAAVDTAHQADVNGTYRVLERLSSTLIKVKRCNVDGSDRGVAGGDAGAWDAHTKGVIGIKNITAGTITKRQTGFVDKDTDYAAGSASFKVDLSPDNIFNETDIIYKKSLIGTGDALATAARVLGDAIAGATIGTVRKTQVYATKGPTWLPDGADDVKKMSFLQKRSGDGASVAPTFKEFSYVGNTAKFVYPITQYLTQPFLATSTALRGLLFADKDYVTIEDVSFNLYSCGSWSVAADVPYSRFDIREHVFDHMEGDLGIPSYYWDAYSSLQLERQLITLNNFSRFDMHRKISLCWWDVLRIFDADEDIVPYIENGIEYRDPAIAGKNHIAPQDNAVRMLDGHLRENDVLAISCVVRNPHPEVKDIDMRLIFQVVNSLEEGSSSLTVTQAGD